MNNKKATITILFTPPSSNWIYLKQTIKYLLVYARSLTLFATKLDAKKRKINIHKGGPFTRRKNLIKGLQLGKLPYRFQPWKALITKKVGILSNINALQWAIEAKRSGKITTLVAGPNLVVFPTDYGGIICEDEIDIVLTASKWVSNYWIEMVPSLKKKIVEWPIGVDTDFWEPIENRIRPFILIYDKRGLYCPFLWPPIEEESVIFNRLIFLLEEKKEPHLHIAYSTFSQMTYKEMLQQSKAVIFLSRSETQGNAMFEAWSMDVPTLIWNPGKFKVQGETISTSSCPYLEEKLGSSFRNADDLEQSLNEFLENLEKFTPRKIAIEKYNLKQSAINYYNFFC